jgi:hypothetical protein
VGGSWPRARGWSVVFVLALLVACTGDGAEPQSAVPADASPGGLLWTRSDAPSLRGERRGGTLGEIVTAPGGEWLVAGTVFEPDGRPTPTVWRSPDGERWQAGELPSAAGARLWAAAVANRVTVVAGQRGRNRNGPAAAYVAAPGQDFEPVDDPVLDQPGLSIGTLAGGAGGFLAVGSRQGDADRPIAVLHSEDGRKWQGLDGAEDLLGEDSGTAVGDVAVGPGGYVMVGSTDGPTGRVGVVWHSLDGTAWTEAATFPGISGVAMNTVVSLREGFVAAGHEVVDGLLQPRLWRSPGGRAWEPVEADFELLGTMTDSRGVTVRALAHGGGSWYAVGGGPAAERFWISYDLRSWRELPLSDGVAGTETPALDLLASRASATLAGSSASGQPLLLREQDDQITEVTATEGAFPEPADEVWIDGIVASRHGPLLLGVALSEERVVGRRQRHARVWRPDAAEGWRPVVGEALEQAELNDIVDLGGELVGVGGQAVVDAVFAAGGNPRGLVWRSSDAESWARVTGPGVDALQGESTTTVVAATVVGAGVVAVGHELVADENRHRAAVWWAGTPDAWERVAMTPVPGDVGDAAPLDVCSLGDEAVALGFGDVPGGQRAMVWVGGPGREWEHMAPDVMAGPGDWYVHGCAATPDGVVAVGQRGADDVDQASAGVWTSPDGRTWTAVESPAFTGDGRRWLRAVTADGNRLFTVGEYERDGWVSPGLWRSVGGGEWELIELPEDLFRGDSYESVANVAVVDGELVLVGQVDGDAAVWTAPLPAE